VVIDHHGDIIIRARYDGTYGKTNLDDELIMTTYFKVRDGKGRQPHRDPQPTNSL
jgi:hypothetical protein